MPAISGLDSPQHPLELLAFRLLRRGSLGLEQFEELNGAILKYLPQLKPAGKRKCVEFGAGPTQKAYSLTWGAFVQGGLAGMTANTRSFPWVARLLVAIVKGQKQDHIFSSISLHYNMYATPHLDRQNHPAIPNLLIPCGRWQGGGLWVCDDALPQQSGSGDMAGRVYNAGSPYVLFRSHWLHSTQAWKGQRLVLIAFAKQRISALNADDRNILSDLGFHCTY